MTPGLWEESFDESAVPLNRVQNSYQLNGIQLLVRYSIYGVENPFSHETSK